MHFANGTNSKKLQKRCLKVTTMHLMQ
jgi:hypothetical protein